MAKTIPLSNIWLEKLTALIDEVGVVAAMKESFQIAGQTTYSTSQMIAAWYSTGSKDDARACLRKVLEAGFGINDLYERSPQPYSVPTTASLLGDAIEFGCAEYAEHLLALGADPKLVGPEQLAKLAQHASWSDVVDLIRAAKARLMANELLERAQSVELAPMAI